MADTPSAPTAGYAPAVNVVAVFNKLRTGTISGPIDRGLLVRMGIKESLAKRVLNTLKTLGLVTDDGSLRDEFKALVNARPDEYQPTLAAFLREAYKGIFAILDPSTASASDLRNAFWGYEPRGQIDAMIRLFVGLCEEAGLVEKTEARANRTVQRRSPTTKTPSNGGSNGNGTQDTRTPEPPPPPPPPPPPAVQLGDSRQRYVDLLLAKAAEGEPSADLLDRIERALGIANPKDGP